MINPNLNITNNDLKLLKEKYPHNIEDILKIVESGYPIQYLIGNVSFYGYQINVDKEVLIPRFETELLVEKTINIIKNNNLHNSSILDLCTGSGCIAIALKKELPYTNITAIDYSQSSINKAQENSKLNKVKISFIKKNVLTDKLTGKFDVIISNPPYVSSNEHVDIQTKYEPQDAIFAGDNGLEFYKKIALKSKNIIKEKSLIALEIGYNQGQAVYKIFKKHYPDSVIKIEKDYNDFDRYIFIFNKIV